MPEIGAEDITYGFEDDICKTSYDSEITAGYYPINSDEDKLINICMSSKHTDIVAHLWLSISEFRQMLKNLTDFDKKLRLVEEATQEKGGKSDE